MFNQVQFCSIQSLYLSLISFTRVSLHFHRSISLNFALFQLKIVANLIRDLNFDLGRADTAEEEKEEEEGKEEERKKK